METRNQTQEGVQVSKQKVEDRIREIKRAMDDGDFSDSEEYGRLIEISQRAECVRLVGRLADGPMKNDLSESSWWELQVAFAGDEDSEWGKWSAWGEYDYEIEAKAAISEMIAFYSHQDEMPIEVRVVRCDDE